MHDFFAFVTQIGVYPLLVFLWIKLDSLEKAHLAVLKYLTEVCPHCADIRTLLIPK